MTRARPFENRLLRDILLQWVGREKGLEIIAYGELRDQVQKNEMGGTYSMYEGEEKCIKGFGGKPQKKETLRSSRRS
jgi:hypothetical protein